MLTKAPNNNIYLDWIPDKACPNNICPGLGHSFDLRDINALNEPSALIGGKQVLKNINISDDCVLYYPGGKNTRSLQTTSDTTELVDDISTNLNIKGSYPINLSTLTGTIQQTTGYSVKEHSDIKTSKLDMVVESGVVFINNNGVCQAKANLQDEMISAFLGLPVVIHDPSSRGSWIDYFTFFTVWGTHVLTQIIYGSRYQQWESIISTEKEMNQTLEIKACAEVQGVNPGNGWDISACSGYNEKERQDALSKTTKSNTIIIGGNETTRRNVQTKPKDQTAIYDFLKSSNESNQGIGFRFTPLWSFLKIILEGSCLTKSPNQNDCDNLQRCLNMEAAYAFSALECDKKDFDGDYTYQEFRGIPVPNSTLTTYACWNQKTGCQQDHDCHYNTDESACFAYGGTTLETGESIGDPRKKIFRSQPRARKHPSHSNLMNATCYHDHGKVTCRCDLQKNGGLPERYLWESNDII